LESDLKGGPRERAGVIFYSLEEKYAGNGAELGSTQEKNLRSMKVLELEEGENN